MLSKEKFYKVYIPALKKALEEETESCLREPEEYIQNLQEMGDVAQYIENTQGDDFLDMVAYYFDAKYHNFPDMGDMSIEDGREKIIKEL